MNTTPTTPYLDEDSDLVLDAEDLAMLRSIAEHVSDAMPSCVYGCTFEVRVVMDSGDTLATIVKDEDGGNARVIF